jgi:hypothetical protein
MGLSVEKREELYNKLMDTCQEYGITTDATEIALEEAVDSIMTEEEQ